MTDEQIIKALEYCCGNERTNDDECSSGKCYQVDLPESREDGTRWCSQWLMRDALDLINCQKAEIERLKQIIDEKKQRNHQIAKTDYILARGFELSTGKDKGRSNKRVCNKVKMRSTV